MGRWYARAGAYEASRATLRRAVEIVEERAGESALQLVGPLTALGECARRMLLDPSEPLRASADDERRSMFHEPVSPPGATVSASTIANEGQRALERAAAIVSSRPDASAMQRADVHTQLGDWYLARQRPDKAFASYQQAWQAAGDASVSGKPLREVLFAQPVLLYYSPPPYWDRYAARPPHEVEIHTAEAEFTVSAEGKVLEPKLLSDAGDPGLGERFVDAADSAVYRPRFEQDGRPVATVGVRMSQPFYVLLDAAVGDEESKPGH
jgi:hypothetical protein